MELTLSTKIKDEIGLTYLLQKLDLHTPYGKAIRDQPFVYSPTNLAEITQDFQDMEHFLSFTQKHSSIIQKITRELRKVKDLSSIMIKMENKDVLEVTDLYLLKYHAFINQSLIEFTNSIQLSIHGENLPNLSKIIQILDPDKRNMPTFAIYSGYSQLLTKIRHQKSTIEEKITSTTMKSQVRALKKQRLTIVHLEQMEELKIRKKLSEQLTSLIDVFKESVAYIGDFDWILAKISLKNSMNCVKPSIILDNRVTAVQMTNPFLIHTFQQQGARFTPLDFEMHAGVTVITGANMGGKTICLKTILLNVVLAHLGFFVFAEKFETCLFEFFDLVSDDLQDVKSALSTFGAEVIKINSIITQMKKQHGFILFDEIARGTNPGEGSYIVKSIIEYFSNFTSICGLTTHYDGVIPFHIPHYQVKGLTGLDSIAFASNENDPDTQKEMSLIETVSILRKAMNYQLELVSPETPVPKHAIEITKYLHLDEELYKLIVGNSKKRD